MIPLAVTAHNEEQSIAACLESLLAAVRYAEAHLPLTFDVFVVLDDCTDRTGEIAHTFPRVRTVTSSGGLVEAQRAAVCQAPAVRLGSPDLPEPFIVLSDADILIEEPTLFTVCQAMLQEPGLQVAYPTKSPLPPQRRSLLAQALHVFNRENGYQTRRRYFNGRFFAIRRWNIPTVEGLRPRWQRLPPDRFYVFERGVYADDIYLSRQILFEHGRDAIREVPEGRIWFRAAETFEGMYRTYRRMRREIERIDALFPEMRQTHRLEGIRRVDLVAVRRAPWRDRWLWRLFHAALALCRIRYVAERFYYQNLASRSSLEWGTVTESKALSRAGSG